MAKIISVGRASSCLVLHSMSFQPSVIQICCQVTLAGDSRNEKVGTISALIFLIWNFFFLRASCKFIHRYLLNGCFVQGTLVDPAYKEWTSHSKVLNWVQFNGSAISNSLWPHARLPCPSPTPGACSNSCPSSRWCYPTISSSVIPFSSCHQSKEDFMPILLKFFQKIWSGGNTC